MRTQNTGAPGSVPSRKAFSCLAVLVIVFVLSTFCGVGFLIYLGGRGNPATRFLTNVKAEPPTSPTAASLALVLDTSGSMNENIAPHGKKLDIAKAVLTEDFLPNLSDDLHVALYTFLGSGAENLSPLRRNAAQDSPGWLHREALMQLVEGVSASGGTPIAGSLRAARGDLAKVPGRKIIIIVTDGEESCESKESVLDELTANDRAGVETFVVGFNNGAEGGYIEQRLGLGKHYFQANGGREALLEVMASIAAAIER